MDKEKLAENILTFIPSMFKRLMRAYPDLGISRQHLELLFKVQNENRKPMSYYSEKMMIPKSNLTVISDTLVKDGLLERVFDPNDRRVVILAITEKGEERLHEHKKNMMHEMAKRLDAFDDKDINRINELIEELKAIFDRNDR